MSTSTTATASTALSSSSNPISDSAAIKSDESASSGFSKKHKNRMNWLLLFFHVVSVGVGGYGFSLVAKQIDKNQSVERWIFFFHWILNLILLIVSFVVTSLRESERILLLIQICMAIIFLGLYNSLFFGLRVVNATTNREMLTKNEVAGLSIQAYVYLGFFFTIICLPIVAPTTFFYENTLLIIEKDILATAPTSSILPSPPLSTTLTPLVVSNEPSKDTPPV